MGTEVREKAPGFPRLFCGLFFGSLGFGQVGESTPGDPHEVGGCNLQGRVGAS